MMEYLKTREGRKMIREKLAEVTGDLEEAKEDLSFLLVRKRGSPMSTWWYHEMIIKLCREKIKLCEREIRRWNMYNSFSKGYEAKFDRELDKGLAKQVQIETIVPSKVEGKAPGRLKFCCPLPEHNDNTASFVVYKDSNSYYCFGCCEGGDVIDLYMKIYKCDFVTAVTSLIN